MRCECDKAAESPQYHGGNMDRCPREEADHGDTSPALCMACLFGCAA